MDLTKLVTNSFKYPFRNIKKLPIIFLFFILIAVIPIGIISDNDYIVAIGVIAFFLFILLVPGYFLSIVKMGSSQSAMMPSFNLVNNIYDSIRVLSLRIVYMIVPAALFLLALKTIGPAIRDLIYNFRIPEFLAAVGLLLVLIFIVYLIFECLLFFAKARLAYFNSLHEALRINKVIEDIRRIGILNIIKWLIVMAILLNVVTFVSSFVIAIPYVGFLVYICIVIPILESIANYSLGLLYSNIIQGYDDADLMKVKKIETVEYEKIK
ncbi:hypothetical protein TL18_04950 [Methanobrevibacter sp. YE315]|uniref:DUF4013 domain-containing protein n=1 Tax=Methanobrevibacter sp. YE315 TaxID=1609968 RepID=UPI000764D5A3|nr:DUF4013 domain-containing protein [Methanobrevibacter sp. YE315]AMD17423.1 hypothetical protein TL18_04950 [Methanobrevibacter sp. YE315]